MRPIVLGLLASFFFSSTFILNQAMKLSGGNWMYSASLRFLFMLPLLLAIVLLRRGLRPLLSDMKRRPLPWFGWSFIGFGVMYTPTCIAAQYEPGWLIAGTWQVTVVAGLLLAPLFYRVSQTPDGPVKVRERIQGRSLAVSSLVLVGAATMQFSHANGFAARDLLLGVVPVLIGAFAYPLGNRKMMALCEGRLDAYQRVLGMTIGSTPLWIVLAVAGYSQDGLPSPAQAGQALIVAVSSGVIATVLFFAATDMARGSAGKLAAVEATQSGEVIFAATGELLLLPVPVPPALSWVGMFIVIAGLTLHSLRTGLQQRAAAASSSPSGSEEVPKRSARSAAMTAGDGEIR
ncbi:multidrug resistance efflux transporter family protein [Cohnella lubricantis]|uniref:Multidrug resistance efflux transporter family protein n=1 Tax=Cohnella lubricantis TaxID=2163172 RepID=A0A841T7M9_9BACL|nr:multidrug resistance efflux transporter family protein [Cohnella lubricantis]MBB6676912.1 multidrug resistance efflux transporter family protein [Cohnella lubricantis]MBP2118313.1 drug/metabolite transporter (DMT)-like permease [Cohnella lubricantis]